MTKKWAGAAFKINEEGVVKAEDVIWCDEPHGRRDYQACLDATGDGSTGYTPTGESQCYWWFVEMEYEE